MLKDRLREDGCEGKCSLYYNAQRVLFLKQCKLQKQSKLFLRVFSHWWIVLLA